MTRFIVLGWGVCLLLLLWFTSANGQEIPRAGLVIVHGDGAAIARCVEFSGDSISGYDLLAQSGIDLNVEASGMGATICRIDGEGCTAPREACFCQCQGGAECLYWSYWQRVDGVWRYSNLGASNSRVTAGAVEGWVWGDGQPRQSALPALDFADVCAPERSTPTFVVDPSAAKSDIESAKPATMPVVAAAEERDQQQTPSPLYLLALAPLPILAALFLMRRRKGTT